MLVPRPGADLISNSRAWLPPGAVPKQCRCRRIRVYVVLLKFKLRYYYKYFPLPGKIVLQQKLKR